VLSTASGARLGRALEGLDFMLCVDIYLNETTRHADLILPTAAQLEHENFDVLLQGTSVRNFVRYTPQVFDRADDAKPHWEVFLELAARLGGTTVEALDKQITITQAARHLARPNSPAYGVEVDTAIAATGNRRGPMRLIDLMLRAGPYGDGFDDAAPGLNLEKVISEPHAIDLGPLEPRMPEILRTEKRRIALAHEHIVADVGRLRAGLAARSRDTGLLLVGRRQARGMNSWLHNVDVLARGRSRCTLLIHSCDAVRLGVIDGERARVRSRVGEVLAEVEVSDEMMPGVVSLPHGFGHTEPETRLEVASRHQPGVNANVLTDEGPLDVPSGTSVANGIPVEVSAA
jgi:anaerobic selenocysteine-containing dehydrogenase